MLEPLVDKKVLLFLAGFLWLCVGSMLLFLSYIWLLPIPRATALLFGASGAALALVIHHFGFLKVVNKNLGRISTMEDKQSVFSFMSAKSYVLVAIMAIMGYTLRHSSLPKPYLSILYIAIGLALMLSSVRYLRVLLFQKYSWPKTKKLGSTK